MQTYQFSKCSNDGIDIIDVILRKGVCCSVFHMITYVNVITQCYLCIVPAVSYLDWRESAWVGGACSSAAGKAMIMTHNY